MTTQDVWVHPVNAHRAVGLLDNGYGRLVFDWTECIWRYWRYLGRDTQESAERIAQPPDVDAYVLTSAEVYLLLGVAPAEDTTCVLFVGFDGQDGQWTPSWAAVVSTTPLGEEDIAEDE